MHKIEEYKELCIHRSNNNVKIIDEREYAGMYEDILCNCSEHGNVFSNIFRIKRCIYICKKCDDQYYHDHQIKVKRNYHATHKEEEHAKWGIYRETHRQELKDKTNSRRAIQKYQKDYNERVLLTSAKKRAKKEGYEFLLVREDINIPEVCPILNIPFVFGNNCISNDSPTIDKLIILKGYTKQNSIIISGKANRMKNNLSLYQINLININYEKSNTIEDSIPNFAKNCIEEKNNSDKDFNKRAIYFKKFRLNQIKSRCSERNYDFDLTEDDLVINTICPLLEIEINMSRNMASYNSPSVDRIDNTKGYVKGNVRIISRIANTSKSNSTREEYDLFTRNLNKIFLERNLLTEEEIQQIKSINPYFPNTPLI